MATRSKAVIDAEFHPLLKEVIARMTIDKKQKVTVSSLWKDLKLYLGGTASSTGVRAIVKEGADAGWDELSGG
ncbi:MAG: hypothetical protein QM765_20995 [Myxococcales bacterium]